MNKFPVFGYYSNVPSNRQNTQKGKGAFTPIPPLCVKIQFFYKYASNKKFPI